MEDEKTRSLLECKGALLKLGGKATIAAIGQQENNKAVDNKKQNTNRTLFSPESLRDHNVPGYGSQQKIEEVEELGI